MYHLRLRPSPWLIRSPNQIQKQNLDIKNKILELEKDHKLFVPSVDKVGDMEWCQVTAVTRHLPIGDLVKVTTESGREATATQQKSFLTWNEEKQQWYVGIKCVGE